MKKKTTHLVKKIVKKIVKIDEVEAFAEVFGRLPMSLSEQEERRLKLLALHFVIDREMARMREEDDNDSTLMMLQQVALFKLEHEGRLPTYSAKSDESERALAREFGRVRQQCQQDSVPRFVAAAVRRLQTPKDRGIIFEQVMDFQKQNKGKMPRERSSDPKEAILAQRYRKRSKASDLSIEEKWALAQVEEAKKRPKRS